MDVSDLITHNGTDTPAPTRNKSSYSPSTTVATPLMNGSATTPRSLSPNGEMKAVKFQLRNSAVSSEPKTFYIRPHDTTDSIMDTVKHLFGCSKDYELGISLEDANGLCFIPSHENFTDGMTVYVRFEERHRHSYDLRRQHGFHRSVSPQSRGRRSGSAATMNGRLKRLYAPEPDYDYDAQDHEQDRGWYNNLPHQAMLPVEDEEPRTKAASVASADISVENIVEGSRRKRPKFSSDELPLFDIPPYERHNNSVSSLSPTNHAPQYTTPYCNRSYNYPQPTPPSNPSDHNAYYANHYQQTGPLGVVPTPAPTVTSNISDEDVALQLIRLGNVEATRPVDERRRFVSDAGEYGEDARSDTTELPDLPTSRKEDLRDSPIIYPKSQKYKSLDEILPSFDTTEPSEDENQPPVNGYNTTTVLHYSHGPNSRPRHAAHDEEEDGEGFSDEADETYVAKESDQDDGDYEDDLDDIPLKMRREKKLMASVADSKHHGQAPKGVAKVIKRPHALPSKPHKHVPKSQSEPHYPISPASPPSSRKPSVSSIAGNKPRSNMPMQNGPDAPFSQDHGQFPPLFEDHGPVEELRPRCQRCRKSKKGCDRQRPCQRCKDAGLGEDQCISEDEAGTRRGRQNAVAAKKAGMPNGVTKPKSKKKKKV